jgi:hypothetical protein
MNTYRQAELLADQIIGAFQRDMQRAPNGCACCGRRVTWPCAMGAWAVAGAQQVIVYPLCEDCAERAGSGPAARRAVELRIRAYIRRTVGSEA